ncbi:MAG: type II toxin-antitoxin system Phd/YefM family antitoxin [Myxococcota bacterium]
MREPKRWPVQDAKARFSELLEASTAEGPQIVTRRGEETAVVLPIDEWRRLERASRPELKELLLSEEARGDLPIPKRGRRRRRLLARLD